MTQALPAPLGQMSSEVIEQCEECEATTAIASSGETIVKLAVKRKREGREHLGPREKEKELLRKVN